MYYYQVIILAVLLPAIPGSHSMQRSCTGSCPMYCQSGNMNCSMACSKGPCSINCDAVPGCKQHCLEKTHCTKLMCSNPQDCSQLCEGKCNKIFCKAGKCSQKSISNTMLECEAKHMCMQRSVLPAADQKCTSKVCEQMCESGACNQLCIGEKCDQLCINGSGCKQDCKSGDAKSCGQLCSNGGCHQKGSADHVFQNCSGGGCTMSAFGKTTSQGCLKGNCNIMTVAQKNASIRCEGEACDIQCNAPFCKIQCETEEWCKIDCKKAKMCEVFCVTGRCKLACSKSCISHIEERKDFKGLIFSHSRAAGSQVHGRGALLSVAALACFIFTWMSQ